jgi:pimeloyl-ACP methyl ester carboxylesterase
MSPPHARKPLPSDHGRRDGTQVGLPLVRAEERTLEVAGVPITYRLWAGAGDNAPSLLFLHGFRAHSRWWDHIVPSFVADYRIAAMDFSGLGDSGWRDDYSLALFAREIIELIDAASLAPAIIIAHSFGASPAIQASVLAPEKITRVIVIDSRLLLEGVPEPTVADLDGIAGVKKVHPDLASLLPRFRLLPAGGHVEPGLLEYVAQHSAGLGRDGWSWKFDENLHPQLTPGRDRIDPAKVTIPLDYIYGVDSEVVSPALVDLMTSLLPTCRQPIAIPDCNHHVLLEQPEALIVVLHELLRDSGSGRTGTPGRVPASLVVNLIASVLRVLRKIRILPGTASTKDRRPRCFWAGSAPSTWRGAGKAFDARPAGI